MTKLTSRKFWLALGGAASGVAGVVSGMTFANEGAMVALTIMGAILTSTSIVAYCFAEAYVDGQSAAANTTATNVNANTTSAATVDKIVFKEESNG